MFARRKQEIEEPRKPGALEKWAEDLSRRAAEATEADDFNALSKELRAFAQRLESGGFNLRGDYGPDFGSQAALLPTPWAEGSHVAVRLEFSKVGKLLTVDASGSTGLLDFEKRMSLPASHLARLGFSKLCTAAFDPDGAHLFVQAAGEPYFNKFSLERSDWRGRPKLLERFHCEINYFQAVPVGEDLIAAVDGAGHLDLIGLERWWDPNDNYVDQISQLSTGGADTRLQFIPASNSLLVSSTVLQDRNSSMAEISSFSLVSLAPPGFGMAWNKEELVMGEKISQPVVSPDGRLCLFHDGKLKLADLGKGLSSMAQPEREVNIGGPLTSMAFDPAGSLVALAQGRAVKIAAVASLREGRFEPLCTLNFNDDVSAINFDPSGRILTAALKDGNIWAVSGEIC